MFERKTENMKWILCPKCNSRIYKHREKSHICGGKQKDFDNLYKEEIL